MNQSFARSLSQVGFKYHLTVFRNWLSFKQSIFIAYILNGNHLYFHFFFNLRFMIVFNKFLRFSFIISKKKKINFLPYFKIYKYITVLFSCLLTVDIPHVYESLTKPLFWYFMGFFFLWRWNVWLLSSVACLIIKIISSSRNMFNM